MTNHWADPGCRRRAIVSGVVIYYSDWEKVAFHATDLEFRSESDFNDFMGKANEQRRAEEVSQE